MPSVELTVQYRGVTLWTETKMDRDPELQLMPIYEGGEESPSSEPHLGFFVPVRSEWGPMTFSLDINGTTESPAPPARTWTGKAEWADNTIYVESFDQQPEELSYVPLPRAAGMSDVKVEWASTGRTGKTRSLIRRSRRHGRR